MINWVYLAGAFALFVVTVTVGWSNSPLFTKAIVLPLAFVTAVGLRIALAKRLSFQVLLYARMMIWMIAFIAVCSAAMTVFSSQLEPRVIGLMIILLVFAVMIASLMMMLAIAKPCPACDGRSPIQIVRGPFWSAGSGGIGLDFFQSGVAQNCPQCGVDWSLTEREIREARANGGGVPRLDHSDQNTP